MMEVMSQGNCSVMSHLIRAMYVQASDCLHNIDSVIRFWKTCSSMFEGLPPSCPPVLCYLLSPLLFKSFHSVRIKGFHEKDCLTFTTWATEILRGGKERDREKVRMRQKEYVLSPIINHRIAHKTTSPRNHEKSQQNMKSRKSGKKK